MKINQNDVIITLGLAALAALISYVLTKDLIVTALLAVSAIAASNLVIIKAVNLVNDHLEHLSLAHQIIHSITIDLSSKKTLYLALEEMKNYLPSKYQMILEENNNDLFLGLKDIALILNISQFHVFIKTLELYETQGGDIYKMNYQLLTNIDNLKIKTDKLVRNKKAKIKEILLMWTLVIGILLYMRFGLSEFYLQSIKNLIFKYSVALGLFTVIGTFVGVFKNYQNVNLEKGEIK